MILIFIRFQFSLLLALSFSLPFNTYIYIFFFKLSASSLVSFYVHSQRWAYSIHSPIHNDFKFKRHVLIFNLIRLKKGNFSTTFFFRLMPCNCLHLNTCILWKIFVEEVPLTTYTGSVLPNMYDNIKRLANTKIL